MLPVVKQSKTPTKGQLKRGGLVTIFKSLTRVNPLVDKDYMTVTPSEYKIRFTKDWVEKAANIPKEYLSDPIEGSETVISAQDSEEDSFQNDPIPESHHPAFNHEESSDEENESKAVPIKHFRKLPKIPKSLPSETGPIVVQPVLVGKYPDHLRHSPEVDKLLDPVKHVKQLQPIIVDPKEKSPEKISSSASKPKIPRNERSSASQQLSNKAFQQKQKKIKHRKYKNQGGVSRLTVVDQSSMTKTRPKSKLKRSSKPNRDRSVGNNSRSARAEIPQKGHKPKKLTKGKRSRKKFLQIKSSISKFKGPLGKMRKPKGILNKEKKLIKKKEDPVPDLNFDLSFEVTCNKKRISGNEYNSDSYSSSKSELKALNYNPVTGREELVVRLYHHELSASDSSSPDGLKERRSEGKHAIKKPKSILRQTLYYGKLPSHPAPGKKLTPSLDMADNQGDALHVKEQNVTHVEGKDVSKASLHELEKHKVPEEFETQEIPRGPLPLDDMTVEYEDGFRSPKGWTQNDLFSNGTFPEGNVFLKKAKPSLARNPRLNWKNKPKPAILFFQSKIMPQRRNLVLKSVQLTPLEQKLRSYYEENDTDGEDEKNNRFDVKIFSSHAGSTLEFKRPKMSQLTLPSESRSEGCAVSKRESVLHPNPPENSRMSSDN